MYAPCSSAGHLGPIPACARALPCTAWTCPAATRRGTRRPCTIAAQVSGMCSLLSHRRLADADASRCARAFVEPEDPRPRAAPRRSSSRSSRGERPVEQRCAAPCPGRRTCRSRARRFCRLFSVEHLIHQQVEPRPAAAATTIEGEGTPMRAHLPVRMSSSRCREPGQAHVPRRRSSEASFAWRAVSRRGARHRELGTPVRRVVHTMYAR